MPASAESVAWTGPVVYPKLETCRLRGRRGVDVTNRRTQTDEAWPIQALWELHDPQAEKVTLVMDHLHTHSLASLDEAFEPDEARRLIGRLERL